MSPRQIEIIISTCTPGNYPGGLRTTGNTIREKFSDFEKDSQKARESFEQRMKLHAAPFRNKGFSVIVRPCYNSMDGRSYYEWRSFNGSEWQRCDFDMIRKVSNVRNSSFPP